MLSVEVQRESRIGEHPLYGSVGKVKASRRAATRAFTLIELLVVVTIIAILASMLLPALAQAKLTAMTSLCVGTEHQLYMGLASYTSDNNSDLPPDNVAAAANTSYATWFQRPIETILLANVERQASGGGGAYGMLMGLGHVVAGGYYGNPRSLKGISEPTYRLHLDEYQGFATGSPAGNQAYQTRNWQHHLGTTTTAPSGVWSQLGYVYRSWCGQSTDGTPSGVIPDTDLRSKIDVMASYAAAWCHMRNWNLSAGPYNRELTHENGFNTLFYDGHVSFFRDYSGEICMTYTYWSGSQSFARYRLESQ